MGFNGLWLWGTTSIHTTLELGIPGLQDSWANWLPELPNYRRLVSQQSHKLGSPGNQLACDSGNPGVPRPRADGMAELPQSHKSWGPQFHHCISISCSECQFQLAAASPREHISFQEYHASVFLKLFFRDFHFLINLKRTKFCLIWIKTNFKISKFLAN